VHKRVANIVAKGHARLRIQYKAFVPYYTKISKEKPQIYDQVFSKATGVWGA